MNKKNTKKQKRSINVFDVVVILLIVLLIGTLVYRVYRGIEDDAAQSGTKYIMYFECDDVYDSLISYLDDGEAVYLQNGAILGYLYAENGDERGAVYELIDDIPTYAEETDGVPSEHETMGTTDDENNVVFAEGINVGVNTDYHIVKIGGNLRLSYDAVRVQKGNYFTINGINVTEGSVITVYTNDAEFTLTVKYIVIAE